MHNKLVIFLRGAIPVLLLTGAPQIGAEPVNGRVVVKVGPEAARRGQISTLELRLPQQGRLLNPKLEPIFQAKSGPLSQFFLLTYDAEAARGKLPHLEPAAPWIEALDQDPMVLGAAPDRVVSVAWTPDDPLYLAEGGGTPQFHLHNPGGLSLRASRGWPFIPAGGQPVVVAVIDTGVDWKHPDLGGPTMGEGVIWSNQIEANGLPGVDDDNNGLPDDFIGWDFVDTTEPVVPGEDQKIPDNDPMDFDGHGTQVAGFVNARTDNGEGISGHPFDIQIMALRAGFRHSNLGGVVLVVAAAQAIEYAANNGAHVINTSFDSTDDPYHDPEGVTKAAVDLALENDVVMVASAGNDGKSNPDNQYMAMRSDVMAVAGIQAWGKKAGASNFGSWVSIAAFYRPPPTTFYQGTVPDNHGYSNPGGTSFSSPQVAGLAALVRYFKPELNAGQVRTALIDHGQDLSEVEPTFHLSLGGGLADLAAAIQNLGGGWDASLELKFLTPVNTYANAAVGAEKLSVFNSTDGTLSLDIAGAVDPVLPASGTVNQTEVITTLQGGALTVHDLSGQVVEGFTPGSYPTAQSIVMADLNEDGSHAVLVSDQGTIHASGGWTLSGDHIVAGDLDPGRPGLEVAGISALGAVRVRDAAGASIQEWDHDLSVPVTAPPVGVQFEAGSDGYLALAVTTGAGVQELEVIHGAVTRPGFPVSIPGPPLVYLSATGFSHDEFVVLIAADETGRMHLIDGQGSVKSVDTGGPLAGEIVSADVDHDNIADLIALGADGILRVYSHTLELLPGFPRRIPSTCSEAPLIQADREGRRLVVITDDAGDLWGLPMGIHDHPAPWPTSRGSGGRRGFLGFQTATPLLSAGLQWNWGADGDGTACVSIEHTESVEVRLNHHRGGKLLKILTAFASEHCFRIADGQADDVLTVDLLGRDGSVWRDVARIRIPGNPSVFLKAHPLPFAQSLSVEFSPSSEAGTVSIFDLRGRRVFSDVILPGRREWIWRGVDENGRPVSDGVYWVRVHNGGAPVSTRVVKVRP